MVEFRDELQMSTITLCRNDYKNEEEYDKTIGRLLRILMDAGEVCKVREEEREVLIIEHGHDEQQEYYGSEKLVWVTEDEYDDLVARRQVEYDEEIKKEYSYIASADNDSDSSEYQVGPDYRIIELGDLN